MNLLLETLKVCQIDWINFIPQQFIKTCIQQTSLYLWSKKIGHHFKQKNLFFKLQKFSFIKFMKYSFSLLVCIWLCVCSGIQNGVKQPTNKIKVQHNNALVQPNPNLQWSPNECAACWDSAYYMLDVLVA